MSEYGGLRKHQNNQHALAVPPRTECAAAQVSGGGIKNAHTRYHTPPMEERRKKRKKKLRCINPKVIYGRVDEFILTSA